MKISEIKLNKKNPRLIKDYKFEKLKKSITEFPKMLELRPIIIDNDNIILGGNMRYQALKDLGYKELPDNWVKKSSELSEEEKQRFIIADNVGFGDWDWDIIANEWNNELLVEWGLELANFETLETQLEAEDDDFDTTTSETPITVLGDLYEIGEHRLLCGDSIDSGQVAKLMNNQKADILFTDPPYDIESQEYSSNIYLYTDNAHIFVMHDDKGIVEYLRKSKLEFKRFYVADFVFSSPRGNDPYLRHILISQEVKGDAISHNNLYDGFGSIIKMQYRGNLKDEQTEHKHQKSIEFVAKFISHFSKVNNILLDLFLGSGTSMVASHQLKRKCYGMELDPKYCDVIVKRMIKLDNTLIVKRNGIDVTKDFKE